MFVKLLGSGWSTVYVNPRAIDLIESNGAGRSRILCQHDREFLVDEDPDVLVARIQTERIAWERNHEAVQAKPPKKP